MCSCTTGHHAPPVLSFVRLKELAVKSFDLCGEQCFHCLFFLDVSLPYVWLPVRQRSRRRSAASHSVLVSEQKSIHQWWIGETTLVQVQTVAAARAHLSVFQCVSWHHCVLTDRFWDVFKLLIISQTQEIFTQRAKASPTLRWPLTHL